MKTPKRYEREGLHCKSKEFILKTFESDYTLSEIWEWEERGGRRSVLRSIDIDLLFHENSGLDRFWSSSTIDSSTAALLREAHETRRTGYVILFQKKYVKSMMKLAMEFRLLQKTIAYDLFKENWTTIPFY